MSGIRIVALEGGLTACASGEPAACARIEPVLLGFSRKSTYFGPFGCGMKLKLDGNLLSLVHNCAAAEAMVLGMAGELFGYVDLARRVPTDHPLRVIRAGVNAALGELSGALASSMRVWAGRRSRPRSCWASCCCRRSIRSARSAS